MYKIVNKEIVQKVVYFDNKEQGNEQMKSDNGIKKMGKRKIKEMIEALNII